MDGWQTIDGIRGLVKGRMQALVAVFLAVLLLAACAGPQVPITPLRGVASLDNDRAEYTLVVPSGIGKFRVELPAGSRIRVSLRYAEDRLFERIEGVEVVDNRTGTLYREGYAGVTDDGRWRVYISAPDGAIDIMVTVVDAYR